MTEQEQRMGLRWHPHIWCRLLSLIGVLFAFSKTFAPTSHRSVVSQTMNYLTRLSSGGVLSEPIHIPAAWYGKDLVHESALWRTELSTSQQCSIVASIKEVPSLDIDVYALRAGDVH
jgi:hypothetical protein